MKRLHEAAGAVRAVMLNPDLRRLQLAWGASIFGTWVYLVAVAVFAYGHGGATAVALVSAARWLAGAAASPYASLLADRVDRRLVMVASDLAQASLMAVAAAAAILDSATFVVYVVVVAAAIANAAFRPAEAAITPALAGTPAELTAANLVGSTIESLGIVGGPAFAGILLSASSVGVALVAATALMCWSTLLVGRVRIPRRPNVPDEAAPSPTRGFAALARERRLRLLLGLLAVQSLTAGMLKVVVVVVAFKLIGGGKAGVGWLNSAIGVGGVVGALVVGVLLVGRERKLASSFGVGLLVWAAAPALAAAWPNTAFILLMFGTLGVGLTLSDVAGTTLLQRVAPSDAIARVFGMLGTTFLLMWALGALLAPPLLSLLGTRGTLAAVGVTMGLVVAASWRPLLDLDRVAQPDRERLELLRAVPFLALLPSGATERLAAESVSVDMTAGQIAFHSGDPGDRFYVVADGVVDVTPVGAGVTSLSRGDFFGEVALLRNVPRTATVAARTDARLVALDRKAFLTAVAEHSAASAEAELVVGGRLARSVLHPG
jgi:MFS family permease